MKRNEGLMNSTLKSLIENINAKKIIIVENDFTFIDDVEELLSRICLLDENELIELLLDIIYDGSGLNKDMIRNFVQSVSGLEHEEKNKYLESGKISTFLEILETVSKDKK